MWMQCIFWLALLALGIVLGMALIVYHAVERLSGAGALFQGRRAPTQTEDSAWSVLYYQMDAWLHELGLERFDCLDFYGLLEDQPVHVASWRHPEQAYYLVLYSFMERSWVDLTTVFANGTYLTTSNQRDALTLPEPDTAYIQVFAEAELPVLAQHHAAGVRYLSEGLQSQAVISPLSLRNLMVQAMEQQTREIKAQPLWFLNGALWYFGRRFWLNNKSVQQMYPQNVFASP